jgi:hypothetical protein
MNKNDSRKKNKGEEDGWKKKARFFFLMADCNI